MSRWPLRYAPFWAEAPFFHLLLPLTAAVVCYDRSWVRPGAFWSLAAGCLFLCMIAYAFFKKSSKGLKILFFTLLYAVIFCFGIWNAQQHDIRQRSEWLGLQIDTAGSSLIKVTGEPVEKERIWRMSVDVLKISRNNLLHDVSGSAYLNIYKPDSPLHYRQGDLLLVPSRWQELANSGNPFEVDYKTMHRRRGICHQQFAAPADVQYYKQGTGKSMSILDHTHAYCETQLRKYVTDSATYGLLQAMLLGDESSFDPELRQTYSETGVIHIVSISGSHVGVLFGVTALLLSRIRGRKGAWLRFLTGLGVIWFYVLMAGAPPSAVRSAIMFSIIGFGTALARDAQPLNTLFAAAVALLLYNPMWLFAVGFQLSFGAVLSIILFYQPLYRIWPQTNVAARWLWRGAAASIAAEILTAPLVLYYFHNFPLFFIIANLLAAILVGICALLGGMLIIALSPVTPFAHTVAWMVTALVKIFNAIIRFLQGWNPPSFKYLQISFAELVIIYIIIAAFSLFLLKKYKQGLWLGMGSMAALLLLLCMDKAVVAQQEKLVVYNVNRHNCIELIDGPRFKMLVTDTSKGEAYVVKQAHTGWGAWKPAQAQNDDCFLIGRQKILILKNGLIRNDSTAFDADILIIAHSLKKLSSQQLRKIFNPQIIVAGGNQPRWLIQRWKDSCAALHIPFHAVTSDGAFIIE